MFDHARTSMIGRSAGLGLAFILAAGTVTSAFAQSADRHDRNVEIHNKTGFTIVEFYASHVNTDSWEENIFDGGNLPTGHSVNVNIDDGTGHCLYDFRAIFNDGDEIVSEDVNVCEIGTFNYTAS